MSTGINIAPSSGITVGTTPVTSGTNDRVFFQAGGVIQQDAGFLWDTTNKRMQLLGTGVIASPALNSVLEIKAKNGLSDIAFRIRNSADTQNLVSFHGDGRFLIGQNASNTCIGGVPQYAIAIGDSAAVSGASETYGSPIAIGYDAQSVGTSALAIGNSTRPNTGIAIGHGVQSRAEGVAIGGSTTNARGTVMGSGSSNSGYGGSSIGYDVDNTGDGSFLIGYFHSNSIASSFVWGSNGIKFWVNSNSNLVLAKNKAITDANKATYVDTSATNTFTIHSGTAPVTNISDAYQQYSADITAGNAAPHFRTENGSVIKLYQNAAVTTTQGVADALTNLGVLASSTIAPTVQSVASAATVTPTFSNDLVKITAQAAALTLANPTGTWAEGQDLMIRIKDNGTARAITWDTNYRAIGVTLPATTVISKTTYVGIIYNSTDGKWDVIGVTTEA